MLWSFDSVAFSPVCSPDRVIDLAPLSAVVFFVTRSHGPLWQAQLGRSGRAYRCFANRFIHEEYLFAIALYLQDLTANRRRSTRGQNSSLRRI